MVYNYVNFINIFYDKELLALNYSKLNAGSVNFENFYYINLYFVVWLKYF